MDGELMASELGHGWFEKNTRSTFGSIPNVAALVINSPLQRILGIAQDPKVTRQQNSCETDIRCTYTGDIELRMIRIPRGLNMLQFFQKRGCQPTMHVGFLQHLFCNHTGLGPCREYPSSTQRAACVPTRCDTLCVPPTTTNDISALDVSRQRVHVRILIPCSTPTCNSFQLHGPIVKESSPSVTCEAMPASLSSTTQVI